jgi:sugar O-acyltransferase (sialic acid O-acetyltransferase NeuD family)
LEELILVGGGGHCKSVIDVILAEKKFKIKGIVDSYLPIGSKILGFEVIGDDSLLKRISKEFQNYHITVGQIRSNAVRKRIAKELIESGARLPNIISPFARVSPYAKLGMGITVMHGATIQSEVEIQDFSIINDHALVEHESKIGKFCHISTGAILNGNVNVGDDVFVGSGAIIVQGVYISEGTFIKAGELMK